MSLSTPKLRNIKPSDKIQRYRDIWNITKMVIISLIAMQQDGPRLLLAGPDNI
jgi:hypothetical protein